MKFAFPSLPILARCLPAAASVLAAVSFVSGAELAGTDTNARLRQPMEKRPMTVRVVDSKSGQPIPDVTVHNSTWAALGAGGPLPEPPRTDAKGEAKFDLLLPPGEARRQTPYFNLSFEHPNYAPRMAVWNAQEGGVLDDVPAEYTCRLERGIPIGGVVRDDKNQPVANAWIVLNAYANSGYQVGTVQKTMQELAHFNSPPYEPGSTNGIRTNAEGRWGVPNFPSELENVHVTVIRDDGSDASYASQPQQMGMSRSEKLLLLAELRSRAAVFTLPSGFTVRGRILDPQGKPLPGAKVTEAYGMGNPQPRGQTITDGQGRFQFLNRRARQCIWTVEGRDCALTCEVVTLKPDMPETVVRLQPAQPAVVRVSFEDGRPAADAVFQTVDWRNEGMYLNFKSKAGADGVLVWTNAPTQTVRAWVSFPGKPARYVSVRAGQEQKVVLNDRPLTEIRVSVRALHARTRQPLSAFEVQLDKEQMRRFTPWITGANGTAQGTLRLSDFRQSMYPTFLLQVAAKGFLPKETESLDFNEGDRHLELALEPDVPLQGVIHLPDGNPAESAYVLVNRERGPVFLNQTFQRGPIKPPSYGNFSKTQTGADGAYTLEGVPEDALVVVLHDSGYAQILSSQLRSKGDITLRPWERLEGVLNIGKGPARFGQRIGLAPLGNPQSGLSIHFDATTDDDGVFVFENLPAGTFKLFRYLDNKPGMLVYSHPQQVEVGPGKTNRVEFGGRGVRVEGRIRPSRVSDLDWTVNRHTLAAATTPASSSDRVAPAWEDFVRRADYEAAARSGASPSEPNSQYLLIFDKDGFFFADDVPPGEYTLNVRVTEAPPTSRPWMEDGKLIGAISTNVLIAPPRGPDALAVQLGPYVLPVANAGPAAMAGSFRAQQLDGKPFEFGGKQPLPQAILFWAPWSEKSCQGLTRFGERVGGLGSSRVTAVAIAVDDNEADITKAARQSGWKGSLAKLADQDLVKFISSQSLTELPLLLVVDREGQLTTKTSNLSRLNDAITEVLSP
jgi:hypothetical protein